MNLRTYKLAPDSESPFAAAAQTALTSAPDTTDIGDTSYFDSVSSTESLVKPCTVPGVLVQCDEKVSATSGNPFLNLAVQLYPDDDRKAMFDDGTTVPQGKRLLGTLFLSAKDEEKFKRTARNVKNFVLALRNIPLDANAEAAYKALPLEQKLGVLRTPLTVCATLNCVSPLSQWVGTKVLVQVTKGKDMDGNPRNEFVLLAASTPAARRKS